MVEREDLSEWNANFTLYNDIIIAQFYEILRNRMRWEGQIIPKDK